MIRVQAQTDAPPPAGHNTVGATDMIRSIFDRWHGLEASKQAISEDLKELFVEAKGNGLDPAALRLAFRMRMKEDEPESDASRAKRQQAALYLEALGSHARVAREDA